MHDAVSYIRRGFDNLYRRPASQVPALDAVRAFAILLVIGGHYSTLVWHLAGGSKLPVLRLPIFLFGWTGVDMFFILSGYLIGRQLWNELYTTGDVQVLRFILKRGFRIWPLYFTFLIGIFLFTSSHDFRWNDWLFLSNYLGGALPGGWSLSTEEQFYIAVPLLLVIFKRRLGGAQWLGLLAGLLILELVARKVAIDGLRAQGLSGKDLAGSVQYQFHLHCEGLIVGLAIAFVSVWRPEWFRRKANAGFSGLGLCIFVAASAIGLGLRSTDKNVFAMLALALVYGSFTLWALLDRSKLSRPLAIWVFYPISRLSYGMYLNHMLLMPTIRAELMPFLMRNLGEGTLALVVGFIFTVIMSMAIAAVTFLFIEYPFLLLREQWLHHRYRLKSRMMHLGGQDIETGTETSMA